MPDEVKVKVQSPGTIGPLWFVGWLFTIGYLKLTFWKGALALILWPYDLGVTFHH